MSDDYILLNDDCTQRPTDSLRTFRNFSRVLITYDFYKLPLGVPAGILMMERHLHPKLIKIKVCITNIFEIRAV